MNPTLKQLAGEVRDGRDDQVAQPLAARHDLLRQLDLWVARGWLRALDRAFVAFLVELQPQADPRVLLAAALTSHQLGHGHVCLDLEATLGAPDAALSLPPEGDEGRDVLLPSQLLHGVRLDAWREALAASRWWRWSTSAQAIPSRARRRPRRWCFAPSVSTCVVIGGTSWRSPWPCASAWVGRRPWPQTWRRAWPRCSRRRLRKTASASPTGRSWPAPWRPAAISA
ncbi:exodeoxyribonuclease V subunit alpha [Pseudomonas aeruginosa]|nr:exodeoxyribonuclease V subunit alpha [Pseudomonas aeruginosa]